MRNSIELIGKTPLVRLDGYIAQNALKADIYAKIEWFSLSGSVKDRVALSMIEAAEKSGKLKKGGLIIEPTSGNTGIGIAAVSAVKGYSCVIVMPESMSVERRQMMSAYGAKVVLTSGGMSNAIKEAEKIAAENSGSVILDQFSNMNNPAAHFTGTAPEILEQTGGDIDAFVAGAGTGGTLTGVGRYLKLQKPDIKIIAVEPSESPVISGGAAGKHGIQGIGAGFVPANLKTDVLDEVITVSTDEAIGAVRALAKTDGLFAGISSGAALFAAAKIAGRGDMAGKKIVVIFPDNASKYMSSGLFKDASE